MGTCNTCGVRIDFLSDGQCPECAGLGTEKTLSQVRALRVGQGRFERFVHKFSNGIKVLCLTPHDCHFDDNGRWVLVRRCGVTLRANTESTGDGTIKEKRFTPTAEGLKLLKMIRDEVGPEVFLIGSLIASLAYEGVVFMSPASDTPISTDNKVKLMSSSEFSRMKGGSNGPETQKGDL